MTTDANGRVTAVELTDNHLRGTLPVELGHLSGLQTLNLEGNLLSDQVPIELGNLRRLRYLNLGENLLRGQVPVEIFSLRALEVLILHENQLSGQIPSAIGQLSQLRYLNFFSNGFSGPIPYQLGNLTNLTFVALSFNQLSGSIPERIGDLRRLGTLYLDSNRLSGPIPASVGNLARLQILRLQRNLLTGQIPAELGSLGALHSLYLNDNRLTGPIPNRLDSLARLDRLFLGGNRLTGCIRRSWVNFHVNDLAALRLDRCPLGLADLAVDPGVLRPPFQPTHDDYSLKVGVDVPSVTLHASAGSANVAYLDRHGLEMSDANERRPGYQIALEERDTAIAIRVTSADGSETVNYRLAIGRGFSAAIGVIENDFVEAPRNEELKHNIPDLELATEHETLRADFLGHYQRTGGLERWGYPTSEVLMLEPNTLTQFYQRGVVDFHNVGAEWVVERRLAWDYVGGGLGGSNNLGVEPGVTNPYPGSLSGPWGHKLSNFAVDGTEVGFADFYQRLGGVKSIGYAKSDARTDSNAAGTLFAAGYTPGFIRQYFQAAVLEYHPGDPDDTVKLSLIGDTLRDLLVPSWRRQPAFLPAEPLGEGESFEPGLIAPAPLVEGLYPWSANPPDEIHAQARQTIEQILQRSYITQPRKFRFPWLADGIEDHELAALEPLLIVSGRDRDLTAKLAERMWDWDMVTSNRIRRINQFISGLGNKDPAAARTVIDSPWFADGLNYREMWVIGNLSAIASIDPQLARTVASSPGIMDGISWFDSQGVKYLLQLAQIDSESAAQLAALPWVVDGFDEFEQDALAAIRRVARGHQSYMRQILGLDWVADDMNYWEKQAVRGLIRLRGGRPVLAVDLAANLTTADISHETVQSIHYLNNDQRATFVELTGQEWFMDGLDAEDRAYLTALEFASRASPDLFKEFTGERHSQSATISRSGYGELDIWIFQNTSFAPGDDLTKDVEKAVRFIEEMLLTPSPRESIIALSIAPGSELDVKLPRNYYFGHTLLLQRTGSAQIDAWNIYRAVAGQFIGFGFGPQWLQDGYAGFMASLIHDESGIRTLNDRRQYLRDCLGSSLTVDCGPAFGELLFIDLSRVMGVENLAAAFRRLRELVFEVGYWPILSIVVYAELRAHTPDSVKAEYDRVIRERRGSHSFAPLPGRADDHGDAQFNATVMKIGSDADGNLEYRSDSDQFQFRAQQGKQYSFTVSHGTLTAARLSIYAQGQEKILGGSSSQAVHNGLHAFWAAPDSGTYYAVVDSLSQATGSYSLKIELVDSIVDDYAGEVDFATALPIGEKIKGTLDNAADIDVFRFAAVEGEAYRLILDDAWSTYMLMDLLGPNGMRRTDPTCRLHNPGNVDQIEWTAPATGEFFVAVTNRRGDYIDYELEIRPATGCGSS